MSTSDFDDHPATEDIETVSEPDEYGGLSVEDDPDGTVDPGELAGTASESDEDVR
jgi:hypothetical protein